MKSSVGVTGRRDAPKRKSSEVSVTDDDQTHYVYLTRAYKMVKLQHDAQVEKKQKSDECEQLMRERDALKAQLELKTTVEKGFQARLAAAAQVTAGGSALAPSFHWEWKNNSSAWQSYAAMDNAILEQAFADKRTTIDITIGKYPYSIDLVALEQSNVGGEYSTRRAVRRVPDTVYSSLLPGGLAVLPSLSGLCAASSCKLTDVMDGSSQHAEILQLLKDRNLSHYKLVKAQAVEAPMRRQMFELRSADISSRIDLTIPSLPPRYVFHGTSSRSVQSIISDGFIRDFTQRQQYGFGVYFAQYPNTALTYAREKVQHPNKSEFYVIVSILSVGNVCVASSGDIAARLSRKTNGFAFETLVDAVTNPSILVATLDDQALPHFVLTFKE